MPLSWRRTVANKREKTNTKPSELFQTVDEFGLSSDTNFLGIVFHIAYSAVRLSVCCCRRTYVDVIRAKIVHPGVIQCKRVFDTRSIQSCASCVEEVNSDASTRSHICNMRHSVTSCYRTPSAHCARLLLTRRINRFSLHSASSMWECD